MASLASENYSEEETLDEFMTGQTTRVEELSDDAGEDSCHNKKAGDDDNNEPPPLGRHRAIPKAHPQLPPWLQPSILNLFDDDLETTTSEARKKTEEECLPFLTGNGGSLKDYDLNVYGLPRLRRKQHAEFLRASIRPLPAPYQAVDASRPWIFYWALCGLSSLGEDVTSYRHRLIETVRPLQNPTGGFGGGHGQYSHGACSYAAVLALACVEGLEVVDRKAMWNWLGTVKQADGGFRMAEGAEEDIRGAYCAMTIITLLNLPLELPPTASARRAGLVRFTDRLGDWIGRCQTYEGGISAAPNNEVHGAYAFCGLACLSIMGAPHESFPKYLNLPALVSHLASMQTQPEGGFAGRTNKLVDACYSHWVGGCWALIEAALYSPAVPQIVGGPHVKNKALWNREALVRYLLACCQQPGKRGGMRDKPSTRPDGYHTCYSLAGLSAAQNHYWYDPRGQTEDEKTGRLLAAFNWSHERASPEELKAWKTEESDVVEFVHPVFVIPFAAVERVRVEFEGGGL
ncbi:hypothetical protein M433DRAFT_151129 [Acidomyces richmondensis BFW]|nr:MAG: hypothetical protein FE78DRAFT_90710 [Acidomyces sp. 'richmondensis']KYG48382.1 hypothetical protein M433DRAFT_151129 [Acidomyces richmondensis BFW]